MLSGGLPQLRALLRSTQQVRTHTPSGTGDGAWAAAAQRAGLAD